MPQDSGEAAFEYDQVAYPGSADVESHLRYISTIAELAGIEPADLASCRVLELGCASGRNLLPLAEEFPESEFIGVDLAAEQIEAAKAIAREAGLTNVEFLHRSLDDIDEPLGPFDYIICLGVFSWVSPTLQDRIFETLERDLTPHGVALVSYKTLPGWHHLNSLRDALRYASREEADPIARTRRAREMVELLASTAPTDSAHSHVYQTQRDVLEAAGDDYLFHDYLATPSFPVYFHDFHRCAMAHELQYVGEPNPARNSVPTAARAREYLQPLSFVDRCQMLDFINNATYRKSILCRRSLELRAVDDPQLLKQLHVALRELPTPTDFTVANTEPLVFDYESGSLTIAAPFGKAAMRCLMAAYPASVSIANLARSSTQLLSGSADQVVVDPRGEDLLAAAMLAALHAGLVHVCRHKPKFNTTISERPSASPLSRVLAKHGEVVVNHLHQNIKLSHDARLVLMQIDGSKTSEELAALMDTAGASERVDSALAELRNNAFLIR